MISFASDKNQFLLYIGISVVVIVFSVMLFYQDNFIFQRFFGKINPVMAFLIVTILGFFLIAFLLSQNWFTFLEKENHRGLLYAALLASILGVIMMLADTKIVFPEDTNIKFPESIMFYPAIGFFVEILFHVLPLTLSVIIMKVILKNQSLDNIIWISIFIVAIIEPVYQSMHMANSGRFALWAVIFVGMHIFLINTFQLALFKKYDFISMYTFRLVYYLFWHIVWGHFRLQLLF